MKWEGWSLSVDRTAIEARAVELSKRSIKKASKVEALTHILQMIDLTTLEGADTQGVIKALCHKAMHPHQRGYPSVAAVCVYPNLIADAKAYLNGSTVHVASVATGFPSGQVPMSAKIQDTEAALRAGADEIDMVISRGEFLKGNLEFVSDEIKAIKKICGDVHLKVILETGEIGSLEMIRQASFLAMTAGADFIKTSTGKISSAANFLSVMVMIEAIRDYHLATGKKIGFKPAGGIKRAKQAIQYLVMVNEILGSEWLTPELLRFGASSLMNDVLMQLEKEQSGQYQSAPYYSLAY